MLSDMPVTVVLELKIKPDSVAEARDIHREDIVLGLALNHPLRQRLADAAALAEPFRAGEGKLTAVPALLTAPPVKTRYTTSDV